MKCHCSLLADFKNGDKNVKTFLKGEQILLLLRKFYRKIGRKLTISYCNKLQLLLNASKVQQAIPAGSLNLKPDMDFYITTCLGFLIKLDIASQTL